MADPSRRNFLRAATAVPFGFAGLQTLMNVEPVLADESVNKLAEGFGKLIPDPKGILDLPEGFTYQVISKVNDKMDDGFFVPGDADGMACFPGPEGKTIIIRNHELAAHELKKSPFGEKNELLSKIDRNKLYDAGNGEKPCIGGTTTILYDTKTQKKEMEYLSLAGTINNCAGGPTPWNSWISCEETVQKSDSTFEKDHGYCFEVPAVADGKIHTPVPIKAMGRFNHEAIAVDPKSNCVYLTEDRHDGLLYRYIPNKPGKLHEGGKLQAMVINGHKSLDTRNWLNDNGDRVGPEISEGQTFKVSWMDLDNIDAPYDDLRYRGFFDGAACFGRGEGIWYGKETIFFACTEGGTVRRGQIWKYTPSTFEGTSQETNSPGELTLFVEPNDPTVVDNADNITIAPWGDLIVCEDGKGTQFLLGVTPNGKFYRLGKNAISKSEFAGSTFSPDGTTLFVNIQVDGLTLAITGPWQRGRKPV